jgi:hypothetical protein
MCRRPERNGGFGKGLFVKSRLTVGIGWVEAPDVRAFCGTKIQIGFSARGYPGYLFGWERSNG